MSSDETTDRRSEVEHSQHPPQNLQQGDDDSSFQDRTTQTLIVSTIPGTTAQPVQEVSTDDAFRTDALPACWPRRPTCPACAGLGRVPISVYTVAGWQRERVKCDLCRGDGTL
jgi:hypothetical protein